MPAPLSDIEQPLALSEATEEAVTDGYNLKSRIRVPHAAKAVSKAASIMAGAGINVFKEKLGYKAHLEYPVVSSTSELAQLAFDAKMSGKKVVLFLGCGRQAPEVLSAASDPKYSNALIIGIDQNSFKFIPSKRKLENVAFYQGQWRLAVSQFHDGVVDEINFVSPSGSHRDILRISSKPGSLMFFLMSDLVLINPEEGDLDLMQNLLRIGARITVYTENREWAEDFAEDFSANFDGISVLKIPSSEAPPSTVLQRHDKTYVVNAYRSY